MLKTYFASFHHLLTFRSSKPFIIFVVSYAIFVVSLVDEKSCIVLHWFLTHRIPKGPIRLCGHRSRNAIHFA